MSVNKNTNGSIMIAALIVTLITGSLVGLFLKTVTQEARNSYRSRMAFQAVNIAEAGLEYAIYSVKSGDWSGWTGGGSGYFRSAFPRIDIIYRNERRSAKVYVEPFASPPRAVAEGQIASKNGIVITKQVYIELGNRSLFANGVLAKEGIKFDGQNIAIDSYRSSLGPYDPVLNRNDNGSVASISIEYDVLILGNADIWGTAATGGDYENPNPPRVGPNGSILGEDSPSGVKVDPDRVALDFYAALPDPIHPNPSSPDSVSPYTLGSTGSTTTYRISDFEVGSGETYTISGNVILVVDDDVDIDNGQVVLEPGASLIMHVGGDFEVIGNSASIVNTAGNPTDLQVYMTGKDDPTTASDETTQFKLAGNGAFYGAVYAPNSDISLDGSGGSKGEMFGAVVGKTISFGGGYKFHYDEDLADLEDEDAKKVTRWVELTDAAERKNMATILNDGL